MYRSLGVGAVGIVGNAFAALIGGEGISFELLLVDGC